MNVESLGQYSLKITRSVSNVGIFALGFFMLLTAADVIGRYLLSAPITGSIEIIGLALLVLIVAVIPYNGALNRHITIDFLLNAVSERKRLIMNSVVTTISLFLVTVIIWRTVVYGFFLLKSNQTTQVLGIPLYPFVFILALGFALYWLVLVTDLVRYVSKGAVTSAQVWKWIAVGLAIVVLLYFLSAWPIKPATKLNPLTTGLIGMAVLFAAFIMGLPIFSTLLLVGFLGICYLRGFNAGLSVMGSSPFTASSHYDFSTIPLFVLMGEFCFFSGIGKDLYQAAYKWTGSLSGGLAIATIGACGGFAAVCGDSLATAITMGTVAIPEMKRYRYSPGLATGTVAAGGTLGVLIPPSLAFLLYALLTDQSIATLFIAGVVPGIILVLFFMGSIFIRAHLDPTLAPAGPTTTWAEKFSSLKGVWATLLLFSLVVVGMYAGIFAPTEGGGFGAFGALVIGVLRRRLNWKGIRSSLEEAAKISGICMAILIGANIFGYFLAASKLPMEMAQWASQLNVWPTLILALILFIYLILGCLMPAIPMLILTVPIFYPVIMALGYDPIWFGVVMTLMFEMAVITPPMGINVLALQSVSPDTSLGVMFKGIIWYLLVMVIFVILLITFPDIATFLPKLFSKTWG